MANMGALADLQVDARAILAVLTGEGGEEEARVASGGRRQRRRRRGRRCLRPRGCRLVGVALPVAPPGALRPHPVGRLVRVQLGRLAEQAARTAVLRALPLVVRHRSRRGAPSVSR